MLVVHSLKITQNQHLYVLKCSIPVGITTHKNIPVLG